MQYEKWLSGLWMVLIGLHAKKQRYSRATVQVGTRSRLIRGSTSDGHVRCAASDGRGTPARPALHVERVCGRAASDAPERVYDQRRRTGC